MKNYSQTHDAYECTHCGQTNRMLVLGSTTDSEYHNDPQGPGYEAGTRYEVLRCQACEKIVVIAGSWHDGIDDPDEWYASVLLPEEHDQRAREQHDGTLLDESAMRQAVDAAKKCIHEPKATEPKPKVGAVAVRDGNILEVAFRGELKPGEHAEYTLLHRKLEAEKLAGATIYTTLEPCTTRGPEKKPCADRLKARKIGRVVIGMLDPDERIRGRGILALRKANIRVDLFPPDMMTELEELNREFIDAAERRESSG